MEDHKIKGNFVRKYFPEKGEGAEVVVGWPTTMKELRDLAQSKEIKINGNSFPVSEETLCQYAYRGFSLIHQGGGDLLTEEEKEERKVMRKSENKVISALRLQAKNAGQTLAEYCQAKGIPLELIS